MRVGDRELLRRDTAGWNFGRYCNRELRRFSLARAPVQSAKRSVRRISAHPLKARVDEVCARHAEAELTTSSTAIEYESTSLPAGKGLPSTLR